MSKSPLDIMMDPWLQSDRALRQLHVATVQYGKPMPFPPVTLRKVRGKASAAASDHGPSTRGGRKQRKGKPGTSKSLDTSLPPVRPPSSSSSQAPSLLNNTNNTDDDYNNNNSKNNNKHERARTVTPSSSSRPSTTSPRLVSLSLVADADVISSSFDPRERFPAPARPGSSPPSFPLRAMYEHAHSTVSEITDSALKRFELELALRGSVGQATGSGAPGCTPRSAPGTARGLYRRSQTPVYEDVHQYIAAIQESAMRKLSTELPP